MGIQHSWMDWLWGVLEETHTELRPGLSSLRGLGGYRGEGVISDRVDEDGWPIAVRVRMKVRVFAGPSGIVVTAGQAHQADNKRDRRRKGAEVPSRAEATRAVHSALRKLLDMVDELRHLFPGQSLHLALPAGGDISIPQWFFDGLRRLGVALHLVGEEDEGLPMGWTRTDDRGER